MQSGEVPLLSGSAFDELFTSFTESAFRLETRESYYEQEELAAFLEGGPDAVPEDFLADWYALMRSHAEAGRSVRRVRVVSEPHSDYTRFGLWLSGRNVAAGEDIRYLPRTEAESLNLPNVDYWIFDSSRLYVVHFRDDDTLLGAEPVTDPAAIKQAITWQEISWPRAVPRDVYATRHDTPSGSLPVGDQAHDG
ncbi:DUF6879 family protein [Streptomyces sp. NPDC054783]